MDVATTVKGQLVCSTPSCVESACYPEIDGSIINNRSELKRSTLRAHRLRHRQINTEPTT